MPEKDETPRTGARRRQRAEAEPAAAEAEEAAAAPDAEEAAEQPPPDPAELEQLRARLIAQNRIARGRGR